MSKTSGAKYPWHRPFQERIYLIPTKIGLIFSLFVAFLFFLAIGYASNLTYLVSFLSLGLIMLDFLGAHFNLTHVKMLGDPELLAELGSDKPTPLTLSNEDTHEKSKVTVRFRVPTKAKKFTALRDSSEVNLKAGQTTQVNFNFSDIPCGEYTLNRMRIRGSFPMGWIGGQKPVPEKWKLFVHPRFTEHRMHPGLSQTPQMDEQDEIIESRPFKDGDSLQRIDAHIWSRQRSLYTKHFGSLKAKAIHFRGRDLVDLPLPARLETLAAWCMKAHQNSIPFSLQLDEEDSAIPLGVGQPHLRSALILLTQIWDAKINARIINKGVERTP